MRELEAIFSCKGKKYNTSINMDELAFYINGIKIFFEFDGDLTIEEYDKYKDEQLAFLAFYKKNNCLFLVGYCFSFKIPVTLIEIATNNILQSFIEVKMKCEDIENSKAYHKYKLFDAKATSSDIDYAIIDLQSQLRDLYNIRLCGCCRFGQQNPYGGTIYFNYLCFKKNKPAYLRFTGGVGKRDWEFWENKENAEPTRIIDCCDEFEL